MLLAAHDAPTASAAAAVGPAVGASSPVALDRGSCTYTPCYCEENALLLSRQLAPLWHQRAGQGEDGLVVWDYHVFVVEARHPDLPAARVWDLDTRLPLPCPLADYATAALRPVPARYARVHRVVPAAALWQHFASDRSHMRTPGGGWASPPPAYPCIVAEDGCTGRLGEYLDVSEAYVPEEDEPQDESEARVGAEPPGGGNSGGGRRSGRSGGNSGAPSGSSGGGDRGAAGGGASPLGRIMAEGEMLRFFAAA